MSSSVSHVIGKNELKPGDFIVSTRGCAIMFAGWKDQAKTKYTALDLCASGYGAQEHVMSYPSSYTGRFQAFRLNELREKVAQDE